MSETKTCTITNCSREVVARGMCALHYGQWYRNTPPSAKRPRGARLQEKRCELCNNWFHPRNSRSRYCSRECSSKAHRLAPKPCAECGKDFQPRLSVTRFCSSECWYRSRGTQHPPIQCAVCGSTVEQPRTSTQKYCSVTCAASAKRGDADTDWSIQRRVGVIDAKAGREPRMERGARGDIGVAYFEGYDSVFA